MRVRSVQCRSCGGRTRLEHGQPEAVCIHCGQPVKLSQAILDEQAAARRFPHATPLRLGMKATFEGKEFEATGRQVMVEHSEGEVYSWEEWVLIAEDGDLVYLEYDEGKWKVSRPYTPEQPVGPGVLQGMSPGSVLPVDGGALVTDAGSYEVVHAEGEFPYVIVPGRKLGYVDATRLQDFYSVEWTEDSIEYYRGRFLDERTLYTIFGLRDLLQALDARERVLRGRRVFGAVCLALSLVALVFWGASFSSGRVVRNGTGTVELARAQGEGVRFGPIPLSAVNRVHRLEVSGRMREESNWVQAILEDENEVELFSSERDMWDESGRDSDGYWHESDLHASTDFVLKKPGNYYVRVYAEPEPGRQPGPGTSASFWIKEGVLTPLPLGLFGFTALLLGAGFLIAGSPSTVQKLREAAESSDD